MQRLNVRQIILETISKSDEDETDDSKDHDDKKKHRVSFRRRGYENKKHPIPPDTEADPSTKK